MNSNNTVTEALESIPKAGDYCGSLINIATCISFTASALYLLASQICKYRNNYFVFFKVCKKKQKPVRVIIVPPVVVVEPAIRPSYLPSRLSANFNPVAVNPVVGADSEEEFEYPLRHSKQFRGPRRLRMNCDKILKIDNN